MIETKPNSSSESPSSKLMASRKRFVALLLIAFVPMFIAYAAFFHFPNWAPTGTTNYGELISPSVDGVTISSELADFDTWVLIQPVDGLCGVECRKMLYLSRQVVTGLGKDANRVQRVVLISTDTPKLVEHLNAEHVDVKVVLGLTRVKPFVANDGPVLLLMDPNHNVMMLYSLEKAGKPMLRDLKHLLKISSIG
ncbi:hypothetical protein N9U06_01405 [Gammaproteobacteria bacterium]|nr:hypothetical protein [Gammaproteobacteria bacterium]